MPRLAATMGVGTILESRRCLLLAFGGRKSRAVKETVEGPITAQVTASALQLHGDAIGIFDQAAAELLARRDYYAEVERCNVCWRLENCGSWGLAEVDLFGQSRSMLPLPTQTRKQNDGIAPFARLVTCRTRLRPTRLSIGCWCKAFRRRRKRMGRFGPCGFTTRTNWPKLLAS